MSLMPLQHGSVGVIVIVAQLETLKQVRQGTGHWHVVEGMVVRQQEAVLIRIASPNGMRGNSKGMNQ